LRDSRKPRLAHADHAMIFRIGALQFRVIPIKAASPQGDATAERVSTHEELDGPDDFG